MPDRINQHRTLISITSDQYCELRKLAWDRHISLAGLIREIVELYLTVLKQKREGKMT